MESVTSGLAELNADPHIPQCKDPLHTMRAPGRAPLDHSPIRKHPLAVSRYSRSTPSALAQHPIRTRAAHTSPTGGIASILRERTRAYMRALSWQKPRTRPHPHSRGEIFQSEVRAR